jgi:hypothetical protein
MSVIVQTFLRHISQQAGSMAAPAEEHQILAPTEATNIEGDTSRDDARTNPALDSDNEAPAQSEEETLGSENEASVQDEEETLDSEDEASVQDDIPRTKPVFRSNFMLSPTITIIVGNDPEIGTFGAHISLLKAECDFFRLALSSKPGEIRLPGCRIKDFEFFLKWLYSGSLHVGWKDDRDERLMSAYALGHKLVCPGFQNIILQQLYDLNFWSFQGPREVLRLFELGLADTKLMDFFMRHMAYWYIQRPEKYREYTDWDKLLVRDAGLTLRLLSDIRMGDARGKTSNFGWESAREWFIDPLPAE